MLTQAQLLANRQNAKRSTGPRTPEGRARSAMNATKSGIYAKSEIIPGEDPAELDALKSQYYDSLQPLGHEIDLVDEAIRAGWQLRRLARAEADTWTMSFRTDKQNNTGKGLPEDQDLYFKAIALNKDTLDRLYRFQAATARILNRSLETLLRLRKAGALFDVEQQLSPAVEQQPSPAVGQALPPANPESENSTQTNPIPPPPKGAPTPQTPTPTSTYTSHPGTPKICRNEPIFRSPKRRTNPQSQV
jgi:hypothetical protein